MSNSTWNTAGHYYRSDHSWSLPRVSNAWHFPHQTSSTYTKPVPLLSFPVSLGEVKGRDSRQPGDPTPGLTFCHSPSQTQPGALVSKKVDTFPGRKLNQISEIPAHIRGANTFLVRSDNEGIADISGNTSLISPFYKFWVPFGKLNITSLEKAAVVPTSIIFPCGGEWCVCQESSCIQYECYLLSKGPSWVNY